MNKTTRVELTEAGVAGVYVVDEQAEDGSLLLRPDTSIEAIRERLGGRPATPEEFEELHRQVLPADREG